jgi:hypothetical protein
MDGLGDTVEWVPAPGGTGLSGVSLYPNDTTIIPVNTQNGIEVVTLSKVPSGVPESIDNIVVTGNTSPVTYGTYLRQTAFGTNTLPAGTWSLDLWRYVSSATGVSRMYLNVMRVIYHQDTVTITGTGTSRTATANSGTPFATTLVDASATKTDASYLKTPNGLFQITGRTDDTIVTITTLSTYNNETGVAMSTHKKLFQYDTGEINDTTNTLQQMTSTQSAFSIFPTDGIALMVFGSTDGTTASRTISFTHDGNTHYSFLKTPLSDSLTSVLTAKGDIICASAPQTPSAVAIGTASQVLTVNATADGVEWKTPSAGSSTHAIMVTISGTAYVADNIVWVRLPYAMTLAKVRLGLQTKGTGTGSTKAKVMYHATDPSAVATVFTSETDAPACTSSDFTDDSGAPSTTALSAGGWIGIGFSAVCATTPGGNAVIELLEA